MVSTERQITVGAKVARKTDLAEGYGTWGIVRSLHAPNVYKRHHRAKVEWHRRGCPVNHSTVNVDDLIALD